MAIDRMEAYAFFLPCSQPSCERLSSWVVQSIAPARGGRRTVIDVFSLCEPHKAAWREIMRLQGGAEGVCVPFDALPKLLDEMEAIGWSIDQAETVKRGA